VSSAEYRLIGADGAVLEAGSGDVTTGGDALELRPATGAALRVPFGRISSVAEPEPFIVLVGVTDGTALELSRLGRMRTQLLEELRDARAQVTAEESGAVGSAVRFIGTVAGSSANLHVFEDALLIMAGGPAKRIALSFVADVRVRDHTVTIDLTGQDAVDITRLGRRTDEFAALLGERLRETRNRTAAFLGSLLPGLDPLAVRAAAGLLRDGVAAQARALDAIHPDLSATLLRVATLPDRYAAIASLADRGDLAIGFKQIASVRRAAVGVTPWRDPSVAPHIGQHDSPGGLFGPGLGGVMAVGIMSGMEPGGGQFGGPWGYGDLGGYWAFRALGAVMNRNSDGYRPATSRAPAHYGLLTPETEDLAALTASGADPTVLAFALLTSSRGGDPVAYEVLNRPEPVTYVYRTGRPEPRALINQSLDEAGFAAAEIHASATAGLTAVHRRDAATSPLIRTLVATVPHDSVWPARLADLLAC